MGCTGVTSRVVAALSLSQGNFVDRALDERNHASRNDPHVAPQLHSVRLHW